MDLFWWVFLAFVAGGTAGLFLMVLMRIAGEAPRQPADVPELRKTLRQ